ncbi:MAG: arsenate reductase ArsC [Dehalococcoidia bacterium]
MNETHSQPGLVSWDDLGWEIRREGEALVREYAGVFNRETVQRFVAESAHALSDARRQEFVPLFVRRFARERLRDIAIGEGLMSKDRPEILFVCVRNAGRSQMAAAFASRLGGEGVTVRSAGSMPGDEVHPAVVQAMDEVGLDLSQEFPKPLTDDVVKVADVVITMGCGDACPIYPGKRYLDWEVDDPAELDIEGVRRVRADIEGRVKTLLAELGVAVA